MLCAVCVPFSCVCHCSKAAPLMLCFFLPTMQTKEGKAARGMSSQEWSNIASATYYAVEAECTRVGKDFTQFRFSWDNARSHKQAESLPIFRKTFLKLPANSPDLHQPVEHCHGTCKQFVRKAIRDDPTVLTADDVAAQLKYAFDKYCTAEIVSKDMWRACLRPMKL